MGEAIYLTAGLRLDPEEVGPTYYVLLAGKAGQPVVVDRQLVLFSHPDLLPAALGLAGMANAAPLPGAKFPEPHAHCDLALALPLIHSAAADDDYGTIVHALNLVDDFLNATHAKPPPAYVKLTRLSRQVTYSRDMTAFFKNPENTRSEIIDTLLWCVGWILTHARILQPHTVVKK
jgi:hypothetical protein